MVAELDLTGWLAALMAAGDRWDWVSTYLNTSGNAGLTIGADLVRMLLSKGKFAMAADAVMTLAPSAKASDGEPAYLRQAEFAQVLEAVWRGSLTAGVALTLRAALHPLLPFRTDSAAEGAGVLVRLQLLKRAVLRVCTHAGPAVESWQSRDGSSAERREISQQAAALLDKALPASAGGGRSVASVDANVMRSMALEVVGEADAGLSGPSDPASDIMVLAKRGPLMVEVLVLAWAAVAGEDVKWETSKSHIPPIGQELQRMAASLRAIPNAAALVSLTNALHPISAVLPILPGDAKPFTRRKFVLQDLLDVAKARDLTTGDGSPGCGLLLTSALSPETLAELRCEELSGVGAMGGVNGGLARMCVRVAEEGGSKDAVAHARTLLEQWVALGGSRLGNIAGDKRIWRSLVSPTLKRAALEVGAEDLAEQLVCEAFAAVPSAATAGALPWESRSEARAKLEAELSSRGKEACGDVEAFGALSVLGEPSTALSFFTKACLRERPELLVEEAVQALRVMGLGAFKPVTVWGPAAGVLGGGSWVGRVVEILEREVKSSAAEREKFVLCLLRAAASVDPGEAHPLLLVHAHAVLARFAPGESGAVRPPSSEERNAFVEWVKHLRMAFHTRPKPAEGAGG
ncbi:hypothetical protein T484DRAFT_1879923, partial [Baffinella frigidus]